MSYSTFNPTASVPESDIAISVVVPTFRRPELLERCLEALRSQDYDASRFEIIVADDDGEPRRSALLRTWIEEKYASSTPLIRYVHVTQTQGPAGARNRGWREARGEIVAFTDDDTIPDRKWLSSGWTAMLQGWDAVAGTIRMPLPARPTDYERDASGLSQAEFATANCFVRRGALQEVRGFDERFTSAWREDSDLQFALLERGYSCGRAPGAVVLHPIRPARWGISLSQQRKIRFDALLFKKHRILYRQRIRRAPPWGYYAVVAAIGAGAVGWLTGIGWLTVSAALLWFGLTVRFFALRMDGNSKAAPHALEMAVTSIAIPPLAVFWRLLGAWRYRVPFL